MDELLKPQEVCKMFRIHDNTLARWTAKGLLPCVRIAGTRRYRRADIEALVTASDPVAETWASPSRNRLGPA